MNPKMVRLLHEGFSISTLENLTEGQLNLLYKKTIQEQKGSVKLKNNPTPDQVKQYTDQGVNVEIGENEVTEKAKSKQQQKIMGLALSVKRGDTPKSKVSKSVKDMANKMSEKDLEDFASTKHKGLPKKVNAKKESDPKENVKKLEEGILKLIEDYLPPHTTKGELLKTIKSIKR